MRAPFFAVLALLAVLAVVALAIWAMRPREKWDVFLNHDFVSEGAHAEIGRSYEPDLEACRKFAEKEFPDAKTVIYHRGKSRCTIHPEVSLDMLRPSGVKDSLVRK